MLLPLLKHNKVVRNNLIRRELSVPFSSGGDIILCGVNSLNGAICSSSWMRSARVRRHFGVKLQGKAGSVSRVYIKYVNTRIEPKRFHGR